MRFIIKNTSKESTTSLMRKVGYRFWDKIGEKGEIAFIRPLERGGYPRFHIYLKTNPETQELILNLHLDQRRPIYKGAPAHSADYEGKVVEDEAERIKQVFQE
jgi:hypothetical protein